MVSGASYYVVYRGYTSSASSAATLGTVTGTSYTDSSAGVDTCYYWVEAWDSSGAHARSAMATASSGSGGGGGGAFTISATKGTSTSGCTITWTAQSGATGYRVVRGTTSKMDNASILVETVTGTSYTDTTGTAGKTYYYWIVAKKSSGYVTSSYATGYKASSSSGGGESGGGGTTGGGSTSTSVPYTVAFNANGGTGTMANLSFAAGASKALTICTFTRTGYLFIGWATSASATTSTYDDGETVSGLTTTSGATVTLYAVWQANAYTIKFNKNGGSGTMSNLAMKYGTAKALTANAFQRPNYTFLGWSTSASATTATYTNKQSVNNLVSTPDGSITLYAVWQTVREVTAVTARARYPWNGYVDIDITFRSAGLSTVSFEVKDTAGNTNLNARTFYQGNPENNNRSLDVQPGTHRFVWDAAADLGQVTIQSFAVTAKVREKYFDVNVTGGTGSGSFVQGKSATLTAAAKTGYTFTTWSGSTTDVALLANAASATTTLTIPSRDVAYEATYTPNTYTVKFNANGGTGTMAVEAFTYDTAKALTANAFTRTGYNFMGWADDANATTAKYSNGQNVKNMVVSGTKNIYAVWSPRMYMIVDLSGGSNATSYPVNYLDNEPNGGFTNNIYKTSKLVLRRIDSGTFIMGSDQADESHRVRLTEIFYMGIFEVTQKQWLLITGSSSGGVSYGTGNDYPVYWVSYNAIRGSSDGAKWPSSSAVDADSFLGKLRNRTNLSFDLPTEAQSEYACRAGTTTSYFWGNSQSDRAYAWCAKNTHSVGTKLPNAWGLYDMIGNVSEWCLDRWGNTDSRPFGTNPKGPSSGADRILRGGCWKGPDNDNNWYPDWSYSRRSDQPSHGMPNPDNHSQYGFRLTMTLR